MFPMKIYTLGRFAVTLDDRTIPEEAWHGRRGRYFLIALLILGGKQVPKEALIDLLWPEAEGDRAVASFHTTLRRLRMTVERASNGQSGFIHLNDGFVFLDPVRCWSDCCAFEELVRQARRAEALARWREAQRFLQEAWALYEGKFVPPFCQEAWIDIKRQALHQQFAWLEQQLKVVGMAA